MNKNEFKTVLERFIEGNDFKLNPDEKHVDFLLEGILKIEKKEGLKYCPCQARKCRDLTKLCPCNFKLQDIWKKENRCWCGLFVKR